ncbi:snRNA-activating protein complex subunit 2 [Channa argus]|uniref:snRNA-activating protein complex subunit 2 n=1 Tax=Channa argus TaxID=215402 RepID=A0A6G1Q4V3_CHAAH|nr:snRNA-activating protein complex subunit 2 [Channa argus]
MKPPPRTRTKPNHKLEAELVCQRKWQRAEQRKLINALKRLSRNAGGNIDVDYAFLRKYVPSRSISEIHSLMEYVKDKVVSCACSKFRKKKWEEKFRKPIEVWTHMASVLAGTLEEPISTAFSQMLIVSSTEPCTLRNCDPPQVKRPPTDKDSTAGCTIPFRPVPHLPIQGDHPFTNTEPRLLGLKTAPLMMDRGKNLLAPSQVVLVPNSIIQYQQQPSTTAGVTLAATSTSRFAASSCQLGKAKKHILPSTCLQFGSQSGKPVTGQVNNSSRCAAMVKTQRDDSSVIQTTQQSSEQHITSISPSSTSTSLSLRTPICSSVTTLSHFPNTKVSVASSAITSCPPPPLTLLPTSATPLHATFGHITKHRRQPQDITEDSPRTLGVKCVVDFERIYHYLSVIQKPNEDCHLTHMESAIVLDLLMSLPEEFSMLDCNRLRKHLVQVYQCLTSSGDSMMTRQMFKNQKEGLSMQTQSGGNSSRTDWQQDNVGAADWSDAMDSGRTKPPDEAEGQLSGNTNMFSQSRDSDMLGFCLPLNPFMVPLKLMMQK